ncbi:MAG: endonuclease V [Promethearchaeota archaeon]
MFNNKKNWNKEVLNHPLLQPIQNKEEAEKLQIEWKKKKRLNEEIKKHPNSFENIKTVAGVDVSSPSKKDENWAISCVVLWDIRNKKIFEYKTFCGEIFFPYLPGFLGFRENRLITQSILKLKNKTDVIICDGHGLIHPYHFGEAVHLGLVLDIPTFGVAKNFFIGRSNWRVLKRVKGNKTPIFDNLKTSNPLIENNSIIGYSICLKTDSKPVFISIGTNITLELAIKIALKCTLNHRQPEPLFLADQISRRKLIDLQKKS